MTNYFAITADQMINMGWNVPEEDRTLQEYQLKICNDPGNKKIELLARASNGEWFAMSDYSFDYMDTIVDLCDAELLPNFLSGYGQVLYNDDDAQRSCIVQRSDVHEIIGDLTREELQLYASFEELNRDLSNCSFGHVYDEPEYENNEENEM